MCLLTTYQMDCFYRAARAGCSYAWTRSHFLFLITSSLYYLFLQVSREQQNWASSNWDIFKSLLFKLFVSSNFCIFLLLIIKTTTLYKVYNPKLRANLKQINFKIRVKYIYIYSEIRLRNFVVTWSQERDCKGPGVSVPFSYKECFLCEIEMPQSIMTNFGW